MIFLQNLNIVEPPLNIVQSCPHLAGIIFIYIGTHLGVQTMTFQNFENKSQLRVHVIASSYQYSQTYNEKK